MNITHYCDPGHGWMKVSRKSLAELNLLEKISGYSYQNGDYVYLEEDCDASLLVEALRERGIEIAVEESTTDKTSPIRSYERFGV